MCNKYAFSRISAILLLVLTISACKKAAVLEPLSPVLHAIQLEVPVGFPALVDNPDNPLTVEGIELGRKLFYDVRLSRSNKISCASCHHQNLAFTDGTA